MEIWKYVVGYEGFYSVSNTGKIRRDKETKIHTKGKLINIWKNRQGYDVVILSMNNIQKTIRVHKIVALAFLGDRPIGHEINHKDGNKSNNIPDNLEYITHKENMKHSVRLGLSGGLFKIGNKMSYLRKSIHGKPTGYLLNY